MTSEQIRDKVAAVLQKIAQRETSGHEKMPARTNAYEFGLSDGEINLARRFLVSYFGYDKRSDSDWIRKTDKGLLISEVRHMMSDRERSLIVTALQELKHACNTGSLSPRSEKNLEGHPNPDEVQKLSDIFNGTATQSVE